MEPCCTIMSYDLRDSTDCSCFNNVEGMTFVRTGEQHVFGDAISSKQQNSISVFVLVFGEIIGAVPWKIQIQIRVRWHTQKIRKQHLFSEKKGSQRKRFCICNKNFKFTAPINCYEYENVFVLEFVWWLDRP